MHPSAGSSKKPGRNEPCPCGSQLKYKKCCLLETGTNEISDTKIGAIHGLLKDKASRLLGGDKIMMVNQEQSTFKMSEVIIEFAEEFLDKMHDNRQKRMVLELACLAWNLAIHAENGMEVPGPDELLDSMELKNNDTETRDVLKYILSVLIHKKMEEYSHIDRVIISYHFTDIGKDFRLDVASAASKNEMKKTGLSIAHVKQL